jgi:hypothetical protein
MRKLILIALISALLLPGQAFAQAETTALLSDLNLTKFPYIEANLDIHAPDGSFVSGLTADSVSILEDGKNDAISDLREMKVGLQVTVAINASPAFANRNTLGITRYEYLVEYLNLWAEKQKEITIDDLSLLTNTGIKQTHLKDVTSWQTAFLAFTPDLKNSIPSPDLLGQAVDIALEYSSDVKVDKAVLYITPLPETPLGPVLNDVIARANQAKTHIFVWMVTSKNLYTDPRAEELRQLAIQTGGQFIAFSGTEEMPLISTLLEPLRSIYHVMFKSGISQSGQHNLVGQVRLTDQTVTSLPVPFNVTIQPPKPIFLNLPTQIIRSTTITDKDQLDHLTPPDQPVEVIIEYPDGHKRNLTSSRLFVDGKVVSENTSSPFERFTWDISAYKSNANHRLQVEVIDELGLTNRSNEEPVDVVIVLPAINRWADFLNGGGIYLLLGVIFAAGVLSTVLFLNWRNRSRGSAANQPAVSRKDPVTQPVKIRQDQKKNIRTSPNHQNPSQKTASFLILLDRDFQPVSGYDIPLGERRFTIGSDQLLADVVIKDAGVAARHTEIWTDHQGNYFAANVVPESPTLVNDKPVPDEGCRLFNDDLVRIGSAVYKYQEYPIQRVR